MAPPGLLGRDALLSGPAIAAAVRPEVTGIALSQVQPDGMPGLLALAGAPRVHPGDLRREAAAVLPTAIVGVQLSTAIVGSGFSVALALSLPDGDWKPVILTATCMVVIFAIGVQGLTVTRVAARVTA